MSRWTVVAEQESRDLWVGGRGPALVFGFSVLLSAMTYLAATNQAMNFLEQREAVNLIVQVGLAVGVLLTVVVSADAISGERERGTFEGLLLTPVSRRAIVVGKLAAASTIWLACLVVTLPYLWVLGRGVAGAVQAALLALTVGTLVATGLGGISLLISAVTNSNKTSLAWGLLLLLVLFAPTQLPALPKTGVGEVITRVNPIGSSLHYVSQILVSRRDWTHDLSYLASPIVIAVIVTGVLIAAGPRLVRLTAGPR
ncbi:ABC-2 type transport system permease protein [Kribbella sp. VKM Ac-2527]|uniref:ABC-2 type transport system permease protein n=1 Tax=Kribbella caucasensis TaxID=2512215 RepID=A0A4R6K5Q3_9ACTN|nr:ABC transporter permease subunit [Kribbella sp. VKM Ac-2527]TDO44237.1 ABC-2 type transport system permease protein [Kribbella sp. VKM Ac-2527]